MNKKGQVFLLGAIVIVLALLTVTGTYNTVKAYPDIQDYKENTANYLTEYPKVVNDARYNPSATITEAQKVKTFSDIFLKQAKTKDPRFGIVYTYKDNDGKIHIVNTLTNRVINIKLYDSSGNQVQGDVNVYNSDSNSNSCLAGIGCTSVTTQTRDYQGQFNNDQGLADAQFIKICLDSNSNCISDIDVNSFSNLAITTSSQGADTYNSRTDINKPFNVDVTVSV